MKALGGSSIVEYQIDSVTNYHVFIIEIRNIETDC